MRFTRRSLSAAGLALAAAGVIFAACTDGNDNPAGPGGPPVVQPPFIPNGATLIECRGDVRQLTVTCGAPSSGAQRDASLPNGMFLGNQGVNVQLISSNIQKIAPDTFAFDVQVKNKILQPIGTTDGINPDPAGTQVFFAGSPPISTTGGTGMVEVGNPDAIGTFTATGQPYFVYPGVLLPDSVSAARTWKLKYGDPAGNSFSFLLYVYTPVKNPQGYIDVTPDSALLDVGQTVTLSGVVRNRYGTPVGAPINWSSSDSTIASVNPTTGAVTALALGTAIITASSPSASDQGGYDTIPPYQFRTGTAKIVVNNTPAAQRDTFAALRNVTVPRAAPGLLRKFTDDETLQVDSGTFATAQGGIARLHADGSFDYLPPANFSGVDSLAYTVTDGVHNVPGKVILPVTANRVWFVQAGATGTTDGRDRFPFATITAAQAVAAAGDSILVLANGATQLDDAATLKNGQALIGQGIPTGIYHHFTPVDSVAVLAAGAAPGLTRTTAGAAVTLAQNNTIRGVGITAANGAAISGSSFGTLTTGDIGVNPAGPALNLTTGTLAASFTVLSSTGSTTTGLHLSGVGGTLNAVGGAIQNATGTAFDIVGGSLTFNYPGSITNSTGLAASIANLAGGAITLSGTITDSGDGIDVTGITAGTATFSGSLALTGKGINVHNNTGGAVSFTGASKSVSSGANVGVSVTTNTGATVSFGGGNLVVTSTTGAGFTASGGGTVSVTGAGNTLATTTGTALTLNGVGTGASGLSFASVSANGAANGIVLTSITGAGVQVNGGTIRKTTGYGVDLATLGSVPILLTNLTVDSAGAAGNGGIKTNAVDSLVASAVSVLGVGGPALSVTSGKVYGTFASLGSSGSASSGVILTTAGGSFSAAGGTITNPAATAFAVVGGTASATFQGSISQANSAAMVAVSGGHTGTVTFNTGTLQATNGSGLQFDNADGTYNFNGTTTLNGGDAGVDVLNGSGGTFSFAAATTITNPSGIALNVSGGTANATFQGSISQANSAAAVAVSGGHTGTLTFDTGTLQATNGSGLQFDNADGTYNFNGTTTLNGGDAGVDVLNGSGGTFSFAATATITNPTNEAIKVDASAPAFTWGGTLTKTNNAFTGIAITGNTGGTIAVNGTAKTLSTTTATAVNVSSNTGATVTFGGGGLVITTTSGIGFNGSGGGTVSVTGAGNTIASTTGTALSLNGVSTGASGVNLLSVSANGAANGIALTSLTGVGVQVTGTGSTSGSGGTIQNVTGHAVSLSSLGSLTTGVTLNNMTISGGASGNAGIFGSTFGTLSVSNTSVTTSGGPALNLATGTVNGTFSTVTASGSATQGSILNALGGTFTVSGGTLTGSANGAALQVTGTSTGTVNWAGALSQSNTQPLLLVTGHTGATLNVTGTLATSAGSRGLTFDNADGVYQITPVSPVTLTGDSVGVDILNGSSGIYTFGANLTLNGTAGNAFNLDASSAGVTFNGNITKNGTQTGRLVAVSSHTIRTLTFTGTLSATSTNAGSSGILLDNADGTYNFNGTNTLTGAGGDAGIDVQNGSLATVSFSSNTTITNPVNEAVRVDASPNGLSLTYGGTISKTNGSGTGIALTSNGTGTISFTGLSVVLNTGASAGINITGTSTVSFVDSVKVTTTTGNGISATGGTLTIAGTHNSISSAGGIALNVSGATIGASGLNFRSISANGGANGIVLSNTGSSGGLTVSGSGTAASGGTIQNTAGADGAVAGNGVYLSNANNVNLSWMALSNHGNHAIYGSTVSGFTMNKTRITGTNGSSTSTDDGSVSFDNLTGSASITNSYIDGGFEDNVRVVNTTGTLNRLTMNTDTVGFNGTTGNDGVLVTGLSTSVVNFTIQNSRFTGSRSNNIQYVIGENASGDVIISGNTLTNTHPNKLGSDFGIYVSHASTGAVTYSVTGNSVNNAGGSGIEVDRLAGGTGSMTGSVSSNVVGTSGSANSGSFAGSAIFVGLVGAGSTATHTTTISSNTVRQFTNYGIRVVNRGTGTGYLNATVSSNNVAEPSPNAASALFPTSGLRFELGSASGDDGKSCLAISGNTLNNAGTNGGPELRVFGRFSTKTALPGLGQGGNSSDPNVFLNAQNTITTSGTAVNATSTLAFQSTCPPV